jgi:hypothetical protein
MELGSDKFKRSPSEEMRFRTIGSRIIEKMAKIGKIDKIDKKSLFGPLFGGGLL